MHTHARKRAWLACARREGVLPSTGDHKKKGGVTRTSFPTALQAHHDRANPGPPKFAEMRFDGSRKAATAVPLALALAVRVTLRRKNHYYQMLQGATARTDSEGTATFDYRA